MTIAEAINKAAATLTACGIEHARLDAELLICHVLQRDRAWLLAHVQEPLDIGNSASFTNVITRRSRREPLQYIIGTQEFWGRKFTVTPDVLIPRPETELIIEAAVAIAKSKTAPLSVIDLCTGSGCIAVALAREIQDIHVFATDASADALAVARDNARKLGAANSIRFFEGDLFTPLEELDLHGTVDVIVSNPPYIRSDEYAALMPEVRDHEPGMALIAGPKGTEVHRRIIEHAPRFLKRQGSLVMEMGIGQADLLSRMIKQDRHYSSCEIMKDLSGIERVIVAERK